MRVYINCLKVLKVMFSVNPTDLVESKNTIVFGLCNTNKSIKNDNSTELRDYAQHNEDI